MSILSSLAHAHFPETLTKAERERLDADESPGITKTESKERLGEMD